MTFLNPLFLLGLAAAAIPLVVHLFNFRRPRRVEFSSLRFLRELERRSMQRVRIRQWLLLALRTLALLCLALAFARPTYTSAWGAALGERAPASIALVVDNSLSTTLRDAQGAYLDQAKALATALAEAAPPGDEFALMPTAAAPTELPAPFSTADGVLDAIAGLGPGSGAETAQAAVARAASGLEDARNPRREVFLISDLQAATLRDSSSGPLPEGVRLTLLPIGARTHANTAVTDVRVESALVQQGRPVRLAVTLVRFGGRADDVPVRVSLDGAPVGETTVDLERGRPTTVRFAITPSTPGWLAGEVRLDSDEAEWDDARYFVLHVPPARRVLVVRGRGQRAEFVSLALGVAAEDGGLVVTEAEEEGLTDALIPAPDAIVLVGPQDLAGVEIAALARYVERGGGVLLFPHEAPIAAGYDGLFRALGGGRLGGFIGTLGGPAVAGTGVASGEHPLLDGLFEAGTGNERLERIEVAYAAQYVGGQGNEGTVIPLTTGSSFIHEIRRGRGALLFCAVAPDPRWSDLPTRGLFAPLLLRAVTYLAAGEHAQAEATLTVRRSGTLRVEGAGGDTPFRLVAPDGDIHVPEGRETPGGVVLDLGATITQPGVYDVRQGERLLRRVAFNHDPRESDVRTLEPEEAVRRLRAATGGDVRLLDARGGRGLAAATGVRTGGAGVELWTIFLALALGFLVAETLVGARWKPEVAGGEPKPAT